MSTTASEPMQTETSVEIPVLNAVQTSAIMRVASRFIVKTVTGRAIDREMFDELGELATQMVMGAFVTLKRGGQLRGCCGLFGRPIPLVDAIYNASERTAREDVRMPPISPTELPYLEMDVTILGPLRAIEESGRDRIGAVEVGRHGLRIFRGQNAGLLLPMVAVEQGWDAETFLEGVCRKAGLPEDAWLLPDTRLEVFEGLPIQGRIDAEEIRRHPSHPVQPITHEQLNQLRGLAVQNVELLRKGATPSYVVPSLPDGKVNGLILSLIDVATRTTIVHLIRISTRPGIPLQNTLFELTQTAVQVLGQIKSRNAMKIELALTVLHDPALHGHVKQLPPRDAATESDSQIQGCELEGIEPSRRAVLTMMAGTRVAVAYDPDKTPRELLYDASHAISAKGRTLGVYSMDVISTRPKLLAASVPEAKAGTGSRPPAVAGTFYPAEDAPRQDLVDAMLVGGSAKKRKALAIMTPHAGLKYSGRVAAEVWRRVSIPESVLIISPKHTPHGVDWAVAPSRKWQLSRKVSFDSDHELSEKIVANVCGMQLDASAHQAEHGIEVQLPLLERLAPKARITGVAMQGGTWDEIELAAKQLANVLRSLDEIPLLVISSDMNHYAPEDENRRRDRLALEAFKTRDPKKLLNTCQNHQISMCGLLPALLVLQTLHELGRDFSCEEVAYATSAKVSGDLSRVVGYAGMLIVANE